MTKTFVVVSHRARASPNVASRVRVEFFPGVSNTTRGTRLTNHNLREHPNTKPRLKDELGGELELRAGGADDVLVGRRKGVRMENGL